MAEKLIGKSPPRKEGPQKVTGKRLYIDDLRLPNMLYGVTVRSSVARGKIRAVVFEPGIVWDEYVIVTAKDISAANHVALILDD